MSASTHPTATKSHTDFAPGFTDSRGHYRPTSKEVKAYQAARVVGKDHEKYGYYTLALLCGLLAIFTLLNIAWKLRLRYGSTRPFAPKWVRWLLAVSRWISYPRIRSVPFIHHIWTLGPLGPNVLILLGLVFTSCLEWINKYYFFPPWYGSAPLFLRAGWIALACLPFILSVVTPKS